MTGWYAGSHNRTNIDPAEIAEARMAAYRRRIKMLEHNLRHYSPRQLCDTLLRFERMRMAYEADLVRSELAKRQPALAERLRREAAEYERRLRIYLQDEPDPLARHLALNADLAQRDMEAVAHEAEMYERLGWNVLAAMCRIELGRREAEASHKERKACTATP